MCGHDDAVRESFAGPVPVAQLAQQREVLVDERGSVVLVGEPDIGFDDRARDLVAVKRGAIEQCDRVALEAFADRDQSFERVL
jgi:hypothetical protein